MEASALGNLGSCCHALGQYAQAKDYHQQHRQQAQAMGSRLGESNALGGLGSAGQGEAHQDRMDGFGYNHCACSNTVMGSEWRFEFCCFGFYETDECTKDFGLLRVAPSVVWQYRK